MAGDWIPIRIDLADDPDVIVIAGRLQLPEDHVVGLLVRFWGWADQHTTNGNAAEITFAWIDRRIGVAGFCAALELRGWISKTDQGVSVPGFKKYLGKSGKKRAQTRARVAKHRASAKRKCNATGNASNAPTEQNRTVEEKKNSTRKTERASAAKAAAPRSRGWTAEEVAEGQAIIEAWNQIPGVNRTIAPLGKKPKASLRTRIREPLFRDRWREAIALVAELPFCRGENDRGWVANFDWFIRQETVRKLIEGHYGTKSRGHPRNGHGGRFEFLRGLAEEGDADDGKADGTPDGLPRLGDGEAV